MKKRMKKKQHVVQLNLTRSDEFPKPMTQAEISEAQDVLFAMTKKDKEAVELDATKNELESAVYEINDKLEEQIYQDTTTEEERTTLTELATATETWIEDINADT